MNDLVLGCWIAYSHEDWDTYGELVSGFDDDKNLVVRYEYCDYESGDRAKCMDTVIDKEEASWLARKLGVDMLSLPAHLHECFNDAQYPTMLPSEVKDVYYDVVDYLLDQGVHCRVRRDE